VSEISYRAGVLLVLFAGLCWSGMGTGIRLIEDVNTWQLLFYRSLGMVPVLFVFVAWRSGGHPLQSIRKAGLAGIVGAISLVLAFAGGIYAFQSTTIANAAFLFAAAPFFTAILAWPLLGESVRRATWIALGLALLGITIMVREGLSLGALSGNVAALGSALGFAGFTISLRWGRLGNMMPAVVLGGLFAFGFAGLVAIASGDGLSVSLGDAAIAMAMGAVLLGGGMIAFTLGSRALSAADLALLSMVEVILAPVWAWLVLGENAGPNTLFGGTILMVALLFNALSGLRHRPPKII
jgi:DME family drug/metabolite transporter